MTKNVYIVESSIEGKGVFAKKDFKKGDVVFIFKGRMIKWLVKNKKTSITGPNWVGVGHSLWIDPAYPYMYLNHSCDQNIGIKGKVTFVALRDVKRGEEVIFDYSTTEDDVLWNLPFKCKCRSKDCRSNIKSVQFLPLKIYNAYLPYIPKYFQWVYNKHHKL